MTTCHGCIAVDVMLLMEVQRTSKQLASYMYGKSIKSISNQISCYLQYPHCDSESLGIQLHSNSERRK